MSEPDQEPDPATEQGQGDPAQFDVDTFDGLYWALDSLGVTPSGSDELSLAEAIEQLRENYGVEPTGATEVSEEGRQFVRDQLSQL